MARRAMDLIVEGRGRDTKKENDILIMHAPADENGIVGEMKRHWARRM